MEQLPPQFILPHLHVVEPLEKGEGADAGILPDDRHHLHAEVDAVDLDDPGGQGLAGAEALGEGNVREHLFTPLPLNEGGADAGHVLCPAAAGENLALFVDADDAVFQAFH